MGFLFPLFLLGALAIGIPILLHLRHRPPAHRVEFSSLMFLEPHSLVRDQQRRLDQVGLLVLRCMALLLLALLFARPFWRNPAAVGEPGKGALRVFLLDCSASMRREGLWEEARKAVFAGLAETQPEDEVALATFGAGTELLLDFGEWKQLPRESRIAAVRDRVRKQEPGWTVTDLGGALVEALGWLETGMSGQLRRPHTEVVVVSDWQSGADLTALEGFPWPDTVRLRRVKVQPPGAPRSNAAISLAGPVGGEAIPGNESGAGGRSPVRVRISNELGAERERFRLSWEGRESGAAVDLVLSAGGTCVVAAPPRTAGDSVLRLDGDEETFDNRLFVAPVEARPVRVLYSAAKADERDAAEPLFYLRRALSNTETLTPELRWQPLSELSDADLSWADLLVLAGEPGGALLEKMEEFVHHGGALWLPLWNGANANRLPVVRAWGITLQEAALVDYALWTGMDFQHAVLRPFAPAMLRDFSKIHVWHYRDLRFSGETPPGVEVLARYDKGGTALVAAGVGRGQLCVLPGGWLPRDSQIALSSKFVPLLYALLRQAGFESDARRQFFVGDEIPGSGKAAQPGFLAGGDARGGATRRLTVAVNLPPSESELEPLDEATLARLGLASTAAPEGTAGAKLQGERGMAGEGLLQAEVEGRQSLWRWLVLAALVVLLAETAWAAWAGTARGGKAGARQPVTGS